VASVLQAQGTSTATSLAYNTIQYGVTCYAQLGQGRFSVDATIGATEANMQVTYRTAGTLSKLWVKVQTNSVNGNTTITVRKNAADGNMTVTFPASTTGIMRDTTNTDSVAAGDKLNFKIVSAGSSGNIKFFAASTVFSATTNTAIRHGGYPQYSPGFDSATYYFPIAGDPAANPTESNSKFDVNSAGTLKNLFVNVTFNARTSTTTIKSRVNGADGNLVVSIGAAATGIFEDTANSDTLAANDDVNFSLTMGAGAGESIALYGPSVDIVTTTNKFHVITSYAPATGLGLGAGYHYIGGTLQEAKTAVANAQIECNLYAKASNLFVNVVSNALTVATTIDLYLNGAATALTLSVGAGASGQFEDATNVVSLCPTDLLAYHVGNTARAGAFTGSIIGMMMEMNILKFLLLP